MDNNIGNILYLYIIICTIVFMTYLSENEFEESARRAVFFPIYFIRWFFLSLIEVIRGK